MAVKGGGLREVLANRWQVRPMRGHHRPSAGLMIEEDRFGVPTWSHPAAMRWSSARPRTASGSFRSIAPWWAGDCLLLNLAGRGYFAYCSDVKRESIRTRQP